MTDPLNLASNDPPMPTGWEPVWMPSLSLPLSRTKLVDFLIDEEDDRPYPHLGR